MATEISEATQLSSPVAFAALHAALPIDCREAMLEACAVVLGVDLADCDLCDHDRDPVHAHADAWSLGRESWLGRVDPCGLCRVDQIDRDDHVLRSSLCDRRDCESGCGSHG